MHWPKFYILLFIINISYSSDDDISSSVSDEEEKSLPLEQRPNNANSNTRIISRELSLYLLRCMDITNYSPDQIEEYILKVQKELNAKIEDNIPMTVDIILFMISNDNAILENLMISSDHKDKILNYIENFKDFIKLKKTDPRQYLINEIRNGIAKTIKNHIGTLNKVGCMECDVSAHLFSVVFGHTFGKNELISTINQMDRLIDSIISNIRSNSVSNALLTSAYYITPSDLELAEFLSSPSEIIEQLKLIKKSLDFLRQHCPEISKFSKLREETHPAVFREEEEEKVIPQHVVQERIEGVRRRHVHRNMLARRDNYEGRPNAPGPPDVFYPHEHYQNQIHHNDGCDGMCIFLFIMVSSLPLMALIWHSLMTGGMF